MFDPKDLLDILIAGQSKGTAPMRERSGGLGGLGDMMGDILGNAPETRDSYRPPAGRSAQRSPQKMPGLGDIFGDILGGGNAGGQRQAQQQQQGGSPDLGGQLKDIFDQMSGGQKQRRADYQQRDVQEDYGRGMGSGINTGDILGKAKDILISNPALGAVVLGGLGSLILGTRKGRSVLGRGIKLGGMAYVGKMAWDAYQKYQQGQMAGGDQAPYQRETHYQENPQFDPNSFELPKQLEPEPAPKDSGFDDRSLSGQHAVLFLKTMIAASATDGEVDMEERRAIIDNLRQLGLDSDAMAFIEDEFNSPASVQELAEATPNEKVAAQVYTAARITIVPDTRDEVYFLRSLAEALRLPTGLVANIDRAADAAKS